MENKKFVEKIKKEYSEKQTTKMDELKELNNKVKCFPTTLAYVLGSVCALILGVGMCLAMNIIGGSTAWMVVGIIVGLMGIGLGIGNYFLYKKVLDTRKAKYSEEIIKLSDELLNNEK